MYTFVSLHIRKTETPINKYTLTISNVNFFHLYDSNMSNFFKEINIKSVKPIRITTRTIDMGKRLLCPLAISEDPLKKEKEKSTEARKWK